MLLISDINTAKLFHLLKLSKNLLSALYVSGTVLDSGVTAVKKRSVTCLPHGFCILERDDIIKQINNMISLFRDNFEMWPLY